jgi:hypothetical protein
MTIEINRKAEWTYRICPRDKLLIERRENTHGARWTWCEYYDTEAEARAALLKIHDDGMMARGRTNERRTRRVSRS